MRSPTRLRPWSALAVTVAVTFGLAAALLYPERTTLWPRTSQAFFGHAPGVTLRLDQPAR